jgi:hypothetical protein
MTGETSRRQTKFACLTAQVWKYPIIEKEILMKRTRSNSTLARQAAASAVSLALGALFIGGSMSAAAAPPKSLKFDMAVSAAASACLPYAQGHVTVRNEGANQRMKVSVHGLPPKTEFAFFVLQVPTGPFGMSWYQGDIVTDDGGNGSEEFRGIFSSELFVFAPATRDAAQTDPGVDALTNPKTDPVHTYHLGLWFSEPADAAAAGCPGTVTPFEGNHQAGIQVLNTSNFGTNAADGPLSQF